jgi:hypothetical protein
LFKEKHASKCEELDVLRVEVAELKSGSTLLGACTSCPIKFVSTSGKVFFGKVSEKASEEKPVEELSGEKPSEQPQFKPKPKLLRFHCGYYGKEGHKDEFCFKRKREERMAKEWANKDRYNPSHGVPKPRMPLHRGKLW